MYKVVGILPTGMRRVVWHSENYQEALRMRDSVLSNGMRDYNVSGYWETLVFNKATIVSL